MQGTDPTLAQRLAALEREIASVKARLAALEAASRPAVSGEHPTDQQAVRQKVTYDWQS